MAIATPVGFFSTGNDLVDVSASEGVSGNAQFGHNTSKSKRIFQMLDLDGTRGFAKAYRYVKDILGYPTKAVGVGGFKYINRKTPHYINRFVRQTDGRPFLYAQSVDLKGRGPTTAGFPGDGNVYPEYESFLFDVDYASPTYEIKEDATLTTLDGVPSEAYWQRYITKIAKPAGEFFTIPSGTYKYVTAGTPPVTQGIGKLLSFCNLQVTWHAIPENAVPSVYVNPLLVSRSFIETTIGKVNHLEFNGYAKGTLLLLGVNMQPFRSPFGDRIYDITYMFKYMEPTSNTGHNFIFRPASTAWLEVTTDGATNLATQTAGKSIYDWGDFRNLFTPV
jgi:hypothetical protein